jgi:predicted transcriptional regulator of viral defense system
MPGPLIFRTKDAPDLSRDQLRAKVKAGELSNPWRGIYVQPDAPLTGRRIAAFALRRPDAVFGLLTALSHHDLTDQIPRTIDAFIPITTPAPRFTDIPHRVVRQQPELLCIDVQPWSVLGVSAQIVGPARAVVDAFRFSSHLSLQVAIEALRCYLEEGLPIVSLIDVARRLRTFARLQPYLRALQ